MSIQLVGEWLQGYGVEQFDGACSFTYKDEIDFNLEVSTDETHLIMHSVIGEVAAEGDAARLRELLRLNYLGIETQGAALSLDESGTRIVLWISQSIAILDLELFERSVSVFLDLSERLATAAR